MDNIIAHIEVGIFTHHIYHYICHDCGKFASELYNYMKLVSKAFIVSS